MPSALILKGPRELAFEDLPDTPLAATEVRIRTLFSGISAGTELSQYRGSNPFMTKRWDEGRRLFVEGEGRSWDYPVRNLGYEEVGEIVEVGREVSHVGPGQRVFGTWGHRTHHVAPLDYVLPRLMPEGADPRIGVFSHIGAVALNGVHDGNIRIGDTVAVFGLGVQGQIVAQAARRSGADVIGIDPVASRRDMAVRLGVQEALDPGAGGIAEIIKERTGGLGADVCIEVSGAPAALGEAIRSVSYSARVVALGFFQGEARGLHLGEEFHHNRVNLVSSQISGVAPEASYRWTKPRLWQTAVRLQQEGVLSLLPLITDVAPFKEAPALFDRLDRGAEGVLQAMLSFEDVA
ncbi:MAG: zinc-binding dehydrogenase [Rhizobiales bacterium]|nr:zinc-binding dehydrogenase [Hyphomicrobiales bacterium]